MRVHRFHLPELTSGRVRLRGAEAVHLLQVLRVSPGTAVRAFDGGGLEAEGTVVAVGQDELEVELRQPSPSQVEADLRIDVAVALLKGDKLSDVVRQGTEIGAARFRLFVSRRSDVPQVSGNKLERLRRVAREAAKQCGRSVVPDVEDAVPLRQLAWEGPAFVAHPGSSLTLSQKQGQDSERLTVITGPEGGFDGDELEWMVGKGATAIRLGNRILRAETAPVALLAALLLPEAR